MPGGIFRTLLAAGSLWFLFYPRKTSWDIISCVITNKSLFYDSKVGLFKVNLFLNTTILLDNPNLLGTQLERASYDLFFLLPNNLLRIGHVNIGPAWVPGKGKLPVLANTKIDVTVLQGLQLLHHIILMTGHIHVSAVGSALVNIDLKNMVWRGNNWINLSALMAILGDANTDILVKGRCYEEVVINLFSRDSLIRLHEPPAKNCTFNYSWKNLLGQR